MIELVPRVGLGEVRFGMTPSEVRTKFHEQEEYEEWMGGNLNDSLMFHGLIFMFDDCNTYGPLNDSKLTDIVIQGRDDISLWGRNSLEWSRDQFIDHLNRIETSYNWLGTRLFFPEYSLSVTFTNSGKLENIHADIY
jgi:hypothetical protein